MQNLNFLDLFSGIGGFALGARNAGLTFNHHFNSDVSDYANSIYARHFPESIQLGDVRKIDGRELRSKFPGDWILCGGFPCQDVSAAGKGAGLDGERSGLFFEILRLIEEIRPRFVLAENVRALTYRGLDRVLGSLASIGYDTEWQVLSARAFGAAHLRERLWLVAYPSLAGNSGRPVLEPSRDRIQQFFEKERNVGDDRQSDLPFEGARSWRDWEGEIAAWKMDGRSLVRRMADGIPSGLDGFADWGRDWEEVHDRGICLGNSVVPVIPEFLFSLIKDRLEG